MTKDKILRKHFKAEFGHDGHGKFMQYILAAMEEYAQQQVKNCSIPTVVGQSKQLIPKCSICGNEYKGGLKTNCGASNCPNWY